MEAALTDGRYDDAVALRDEFNTAVLESKRSEQRKMF